MGKQNTKFHHTVAECGYSSKPSQPFTLTSLFFVCFTILEEWGLLGLLHGVEFRECGRKNEQNLLTYLL
jgi:hypothetical protein